MAVDSLLAGICLHLFQNPFSTLFATTLLKQFFRRRLHIPKKRPRPDGFHRGAGTTAAELPIQ